MKSRFNARECLSSRAVEDGNLISGAQSKHACQVLRFVCGQLEGRVRRKIRRIEPMHEGIV